ncbi:hypothetical protein [Marinobacter sp. KMM 10035]|uniref:hypothetical protein n=1 Tax=Marinobacter sp. KMM 10035 TaxID=3134034 RepID=UPI00397AEFAA
MRLFVQGCLILLLCFFSSAASAAVFYYETYAEALAACQAIGTYQCDGRPGEFRVLLKKYGSVYNENRVASEWGGCPSGPVDLNTGYCVDPGPVCTSPDFIHPDSGECVSPKSPSECREVGEFYDRSTKLCVTECFWGVLGNICLLEPETEPQEPDQPECGPDHPDFKGVIGFGGEAAIVCGDPENQCPVGSTYGFHEQDDGSYKPSCYPPEANAPQCPGGLAVIMGKKGISFQCGEIRNPNATPEDLLDAVSGDSTGDGAGDLTGIGNQLSKIQQLIQKGNSDTSNISESLKGIGKQLDSGTKAIVDAIGNIPGGGGGGGSNPDPGDGETPDPVTWSGTPIDMELTDPANEYNQVLQDYESAMNTIKAEIQSMFSSDLSGGGSVDDNIQTIMGVDVNFSLNRFLPGLNILGAIILFCAAFISAGILFTNRG